MKHQYFGDVNDYVKYGLLRVLSRAARLRTGVVWMLTPDDDRPDGSRTAYWNDPAWRVHDPELFDRLARLATQRAARGLDLFRRWNLVPDALDVDTELPENAQARAAWMAAAQEALAPCPLWCFDPDNGFEVASVELGKRGSTRYLYWSEAAAAWDAGHSLLVGQHHPREAREDFESELCAQAEARLPGASLTLFRTAHALFLLAARPAHADALALATADVAAAWAGRIEISVRSAGGDRAGDLRAVCEALLRDGTAAAAAALERRYPFVAPAPDPDDARARRALRVWSADGFIDREDGGRLVFPGTLHVLAFLLPDAFPYRPGLHPSAAHAAWWSVCPSIDAAAPERPGRAAEDGVTTSQRHHAAREERARDDMPLLRPPGDLERWDGLCAWFRSAIETRPELLEHAPIRAWAERLARETGAPEGDA